MPTPTYDLISEQVLASAASSVTFSSIPQTYKDLVLECDFTVSADAHNYFRLNGDTGTNYSHTYMFGDGTSTTSGRITSQPQITPFYTTTALHPIVIAHIASYANSSVYKTMLFRSGEASNTARSDAALWRSTAAVLSISMTRASGNYNAGSTFRLYGIAG